jgi:hypothetical protein
MNNVLTQKGLPWSHIYSLSLGKELSNIVISFSSRAVHRTVLQLTNRSGTNQNVANI